MEAGGTTFKFRSELGEDQLTNLIHNSAEIAFDAVPIVPIVMVAVTEGRAVLVGSASFAEAIERGKRRITKASIFSALSATLFAMDAGIVSVPSTTAARIAWNRVSNEIAMDSFVREKTEELSMLIPSPQN